MHLVYILMCFYIPSYYVAYHNFLLFIQIFSTPLQFHLSILPSPFFSSFFMSVSFISFIVISPLNNYSAFY